MIIEVVLRTVILNVFETDLYSSVPLNEAVTE